MTAGGRDYVEVIYNETDRPFTAYPDKLARYLVGRYQLHPGQKLLDVGCGRGEFLRGFIRCGMSGYGVDQSKAATTVCPEAEVKHVDMEHERLPYADNTFDVVFSKSVLEHFYYPERLVQEMRRILKPGGLIIAMVPDWEAIYRIFYEDFSHRSPFMVSSLRDILLISGFASVQAEKFRQLPLLWKQPWLIPFSVLLAAVTPRWLGKHSKTVRFSKELMLLASAQKPNV